MPPLQSRRRSESLIGPAESWKHYRRETFEEIIKEGRKVGVRLEGFARDHFTYLMCTRSMRPLNVKGARSTYASDTGE